MGLYAGCSADGPTAPSPVDGSGAPQSLALSGASAQEDFNCTNIGEVNVRFGDPGWVNDNVVGLYVDFSGVPDLPMTLQVAWDYESAWGEFEKIPVEDGDVSRDGDRLEIEKVIEHTYQDLNEATKRRVRAELVLDGQTGNCARVREVTVEPPATIVCSVLTSSPTLRGTKPVVLSSRRVPLPLRTRQYRSRWIESHQNPVESGAGLGARRLGLSSW